MPDTNKKRLYVRGTTRFDSSWAAPGTGPLNFKGKKVGALVMSKDESVRFGAEQALAEAITAQGAEGLPVYGLVPAELTRDREKAKDFLKKTGLTHAILIRLAGKDEELHYMPGSVWYLSPRLSPSTSCLIAAG